MTDMHQFVLVIVMEVRMLKSVILTTSLSAMLGTVILSAGAAYAAMGFRGGGGFSHLNPQPLPPGLTTDATGRGGGSGKVTLGDMQYPRFRGGSGFNRGFAGGSPVPPAPRTHPPVGGRPHYLYTQIVDHPYIPPVCPHGFHCGPW